MPESPRHVRKRSVPSLRLPFTISPDTDTDNVVRRYTTLSSRRRRPLSMNLPSRRLLRPLAFLALLLLLLYLAYTFFRTARVANLNDVPSPHLVDRALVLAKTKKEDVAWAHHVPGWTPYIYTASSPPEPGYSLRPASLRGREAMTYLTYIIDFYDALPNVTAFVHAGREQWHNEDLGPRTSTILENLRLDTVRRRGYVNFRCMWDPGCPVGVAPFEPTDIDIRGKDIRAYFPDVYMELLGVPQSAVPERIGNVCCGQFAVTKERIRERRREDYVRMRRWAMESSVTDSFGVGWVFEKIWHIIFGMEAEYCPDPRVCRCELFGWCGGIEEGGVEVEGVRLGVGMEEEWGKGPRIP